MPLRILAPDDPALQAYRQRLNDPSFVDVSLDIIPFATYREKLDAALAAEQSTHEVVFVPGHLWIPELAANGKLQQLDTLDADWDTYTADTIVPSVNDEAYYDGNRYMLPLFTDGHILLYDPEKVSITDDTVDVRDLRQIAQNAQISEGQHVLALKAHASEIFLDWLPYLYAEGGHILDDIQQPAFNTDAGRRALENYIALAAFTPTDTHMYDNDAIATALRRGDVGMAVTWGGQAAPIFLAEGSVAPNRYKVAAITTPWNATWGAAIPTNLPKDRQQAALDMLLRLNTVELDTLVITLAGSPVRQSSYSDQNIQHYPWLKAQQQMLTTARLLPKHPQMGHMLGVLYTQVYQAFRGQKTAAEALAQAEADILK